MALDAVQQLAGAGGVHCSDKILMTINRPDNFQQTIDLSFEHFSLGRHTDVSLVADGGEKVNIHGFLLSAASPFLCELLSSSHAPCRPDWAVLLPGHTHHTLSCLAQLLYGATVLACRDTLVQLYRLVDILGIQLSLVTTTATTELVPAQQEDQVDGTKQEAVSQHERDQELEVQDSESKAAYKEFLKSETRPRSVADSVKMLKIDDKNNISSASPVAEETVGEEEGAGQSAGLPLCCYHCSQPFPNFPALSQHKCGGAGRGAGRRHHRCPQCGTVLSSMWRLRQHLAAHQPVRTPGGDHPYGRSSRRAGVGATRHGAVQQAGDHGYSAAGARPVRLVKPSEGAGRDHGYCAGTQEPASPGSPELEEDAGAGGEALQQTAPHRTPPGSGVTSEHSYGTRRDSSPEPEQGGGGAGRDRSDHPYSTAGEVGHQERNTRAADRPGDHQYFTARERSSPRFRALVPKQEPPSPAPAPAPAHPCSQCDKTFPQSYRLRRHIREVHDHEKKFECEDCVKRFFKAQALIRHQLTVHQKVRAFSCQHCQAKFKEKSALTYHLKKNVCRGGNQPILGV